MFRCFGGLSSSHGANRMPCHGFGAAMAKKLCALLPEKVAKDGKCKVLETRLPSRARGLGAEQLL